MGHLINITNQLVNTCSTTALGQFLKEAMPDAYESFEKFRDSTLQEINKTQETLLVNMFRIVLIFLLKLYIYRAVPIRTLLMKTAMNTAMYRLHSLPYCNSRYVATIIARRRLVCKKL